MKDFLINKIEFTLFEVRIPEIGADPSGFGAWYQSGPGAPQKRFAVRIFTDNGPVGAYIPPRSRATVIKPPAIALPIS